MSVPSQAAPLTILNARIDDLATPDEMRKLKVQVVALGRGSQASVPSEASALTILNARIADPADPTTEVGGRLAASIKAKPAKAVQKVSEKGLGLESLFDFTANREVVLAAVAQNGLALKSAAVKLQADQEMLQLTATSGVV